VNPGPAADLASFELALPMRSVTFRSDANTLTFVKEFRGSAGAELSIARAPRWRLVAQMAEKIMRRFIRAPQLRVNYGTRLTSETI
jgi:hypothetical protein